MDDVRTGFDVQKDVDWKATSCTDCTGDELVARLEEADPEAAQTVRERVAAPKDEDISYFPRFVVEELGLVPSSSSSSSTSASPPQQTRSDRDDGGGGWSIVVGTTGIDGMDVTLTVVCRSADVRERLEHERLMVTVAFAVRCISRLREACGGVAEFAPGRRALRVTVILCRREREIPHAGVIGPKHVNAGVTSLMTKHVIVYRAQHVHKVLVHELVHCAGLDAQLHGMHDMEADADAWVRAGLGYDTVAGGGLRCHEAYVETLACYWNMFRWCPRAGRAEWEGERALFEANSASIWRQQTRHRQRSGIPTLLEATHVLAYYHIKAALWSMLHLVPAWPKDGLGVSAFWSAVKAGLRRNGPPRPLSARQAAPFESDRFGGDRSTALMTGIGDP